MATLVCLTSQASSSNSLPAAFDFCCASDDGFIQEDDSVPASIGQSDVDADEALETLIQHELEKYQHHQAERYAALLSEGSALLPLPSPAPEQQQLRAQQRQQEVLADVASFEEQERVEYAPSAWPILDTEQLSQHAVTLGSCSCSSLHQLPEQQHPTAAPEAQLSNDVAMWQRSSELVHSASLQAAAASAAVDDSTTAPSDCFNSDAAGGLAAGESEGDVTTGGSPAHQCIKQNLQLQPCSSTGAASLGDQQFAEHSTGSTAEAGDPTAAVLESSPAEADTGTCCEVDLGPAVTKPEELAACLVPTHNQQQQQDGEQLQVLDLASVQSASDEAQCRSCNLCTPAPAAQAAAPPCSPSPTGEVVAEACTDLPLVQTDAAPPIAPHLAPLQQQQQQEEGVQEQQQQQQHHQQQAKEQQHMLVLQPASRLQQQLLGEGCNTAEIGPDAATITGQGPTVHANQQPQHGVAGGLEHTEETDCHQQPDEAQYAIPPKAMSPVAQIAAAADSGQGGECQYDSLICAGSHDQLGTLGADVAGYAAPKPAAYSTAGRTDTAAAAALSPPPLGAAAVVARAGVSAAVVVGPLWHDHPEGLCPWTTFREQEGGPVWQAPVHNRQDTGDFVSGHSSQTPAGVQQYPSGAQQQQYGRASTATSSSQGSRQQQACSLGSVRPSSAPAGGGGSSRGVVRGSRGSAASPTTHQHLQLQHHRQAGVLAIVAESSQEGVGHSSHRSSMMHQWSVLQPAGLSSGSDSQAAGPACCGWAGSSSQVHGQCFQQQLLVQHMQQMQLSRPCSADPGRARQRQGRSSHHHQQRLLQPQPQQPSRQVFAPWDASPIPLNTPKWVPIAQATLPANAASSGCAARPMTATSATAWAAAGASTALGSYGWPLAGSSSNSSGRSALGGSCLASMDAARPHTAGPVMMTDSPWHGVWEQQQLLSQQQHQLRQHQPGNLTARCSSSSPSRHHDEAYSSSTAGLGGLGGRPGTSCSRQAGLAGSMQTRGAAARPAGMSYAPGGSSSAASAGVSAYLLDVLQQIRQANVWCRQQGLCTQYRLAQGSSKQDKWKLEQIEVELWSRPNTQQRTQQQQLDCKEPKASTSAGSAPAAAASSAVGASLCGSEWQLKRRLSLQQFNQHVSKLKAYTAAAAGSPTRSRPQTQALPYTGLDAGCCRSLASSRPLQAGRGALSPERYGTRRFATFGSGDSSSSSRAPGIIRHSSTSRSGSGSSSAGTCQLLVLSPRGSGGSSMCAVQCPLRSASAPRRCSRLSPGR